MGYGIARMRPAGLHPEWLVIGSPVHDIAIAGLLEEIRVTSLFDSHGLIQPTGGCPWWLDGLRHCTNELSSLASSR